MSISAETAARVPIIGQSYDVLGCTLIPLVKCSCGHQFTVMAQFVGAQLVSVPIFVTGIALALFLSRRTPTKRG